MLLGLVGERATKVDRVCYYGWHECAIKTSKWIVPGLVGGFYKYCLNKRTSCLLTMLV